MANLFWGVSDALDLYGEYINAKKQKVHKPESTLCAQECSNQKQKDSDEIAQNTEHSKDNDQKEYSDKATVGKADKDDMPYLNSETIDNNENTEFSGFDVSNEIIINKEMSKDGMLKTQLTEKNVEFDNKHQNANDVDDQKKKAEISEDKLMSNKKVCPTDGKNIEISIETCENHTENAIKEASATKNTAQDLKNSTEIIRTTDVDPKNANTLKEDDNFFTNPAVDITDSLYPEITEPVDSIINSTELKEDMKSSDENNLEKTDMEIRKSKIDDMKEESSKNELSNVEDNTKYKPPNNANEFTERQNAGEEKLLPNPSNDSAFPNQETSEEPKPNVLNILIYGGGDPRHIIKTIAKRYTHYENEGTASSLPILKFYIVDGCMEIVARNIVLLGIALEKPELISLRNKVHLFMDVYGNSLLRPICHQYLISKSLTLLKMVSDSETLAKIAPILHIDKLKYREVDALQDAFEFWQPKPEYDFNIKDYWMSRLRRLLTVRYDAREGVFDWDLNMSLKDRGGQQICSQEYRYWRETGIAFTFPEYEQCKPNKTLSAGLVRNGGRYLHRGYIGDIQTGPFCTFGLRSMEERMHRSAHGENDYRATDVAERNLLEYFHEIQNGTAYVHNNELSRKYGGVRFQMGERLIHNECDMKGICAYDQPWINVEGIEVHFLPLHEVHEIGKGESKWETFFDISFIGYKYFDFLTNSFPKVLRENSLLILETKLRSVEIKNRIVEFETELQEYARDAKLLSVLNYNALNSKNSILKFWKPEKSVDYEGK